MIKKIDLHIHTKKTISDYNFVFSLEKLKRYVTDCNIDAIAITNHNCFDLEQFMLIRDTLGDQCTVFPGIEINIGKHSAGHILCISDDKNIYDFKEKCNKVEAEIKKPSDYINVEILKDIFPVISNYLWIPHYDKKPQVDKSIIKELSDIIQCGEVQSIKKFIYCIKDPGSLTPVYFSDCRLEDDSEYPLRQTFVNVDEINVPALKRAFVNKNNVTLSEGDANKRFQVLNDLIISTGLNVMLGERSSGKTYTLEKINHTNDNIKYIKQFQLVETDPEKEAKKFSDEIAAKQSGIAKEHFNQFSSVIDDIKNVSIKEDEKRVDNFLKSLIKNANEQNRNDSFAKCNLFRETEYTINDLSIIRGLIDAVKTLIDSKNYKPLIDQYISNDSLIELYRALITKHNEEKEEALKKEWVNDTINNIKRSLQLRTSVTSIKDVDFYEIQKNRIKVKKFNDLVALIREKDIIQKSSFESFTVQVVKGPFESPSELKKVCGKRDVTFSDAFEYYNENPYNYLVSLINKEGISETDYYKYFAKVDYQILNKYGFPLSGGERAEFNLLKEINDARQFEMLLIDEPESSFDNLFLKDRVNSIIKSISDEMPVIIVTHNSTVGLSIKPDFIVFTKRIVNGKDVKYERYFGLPSSQYLKTMTGKCLNNHDILLDSLEAGENAYNERMKEYDLLKD